MPKESKLGVDIGGNYVLSAVGQADDVALISNNIHKLQIKTCSITNLVS